MEIACSGTRPAPQPLAGFRLPIWAIFTPADFGALDERLDAVAELILAVEVLLLQPDQADDFGIDRETLSQTRFFVNDFSITSGLPEAMVFTSAYVSAVASTSSACGTFSPDC